MTRPLVAAVLLLAAHTLAVAQPPADPYAGKTAVLKRDKIPLVTTDKAGKSTTLGDTGTLAIIYVPKSSGDKVLVRYQAQDVWLPKTDVMLPAEAITHFTTVLTADPKDVPALIRRGSAHLLSGQPDKALDDLNEAVKLDPKSAAALSYRANAWRAKREFEKAMADYDAAVKLDPTWWPAIGNRGGLREQMRDTEGAIKDHDAAIKLDPGWAIPFNNRGRAWETKKDFDKALADYAEALRLDPGFGLARANRAELFRRQGKLEEAMKEFNTLVEQFPAAPQYLTARASAHQQARDYAKTLADLEAALKLDPKNPYYMHFLALMLSVVPDDKLRDGKRAVELATNALELGKVELHFEGLAAAHAEAGDFDKAVDAQKKLIKWMEEAKHPSLPVAKQNLATLEAKMPFRLPK